MIQCIICTRGMEQVSENVVCSAPEHLLSHMEFCCPVPFRLLFVQHKLRQSLVGWVHFEWKVERVLLLYNSHWQFLLSLNE